MGQSMNMFTQDRVKGDVCAQPSPNTLSVQVDPSSASTIVAGSAVKLTGQVGKTIIVDLAAETDIVFAYVIHSGKKNSYTARQMAEVVLPGSAIVLQAYGAITRGGRLEWYPTGTKVKQALGVNPVSGLALDTAADGGLLRVLIEAGEDFSSSSSSSSSRSSSSSSSCRSSSSSSSSRSSSSSSRSSSSSCSSSSSRSSSSSSSWSCSSSSSSV